MYHSWLCWGGVIFGVLVLQPWSTDKGSKTANFRSFVGISSSKRVNAGKKYCRAGLQDITASLGFWVFLRLLLRSHCSSKSSLSWQLQSLHPAQLPYILFKCWFISSIIACYTVDRGVTWFTTCHKPGFGHLCRQEYIFFLSLWSLHEIIELSLSPLYSHHGHTHPE